MFSGTAAGHLLPPYIVYKSKHVYDTWTENGPAGATYGSSTSGWFELESFEDWFQRILLLYSRKLAGPKLIIGDNLSSHISVEVAQQCIEHDI